MLSQVHLLKIESVYDTYTLTEHSNSIKENTLKYACIYCIQYILVISVRDVWFYILNARQWATIAVAPGHDSWLYTIYSELYYIKNNMTVTGHYDYN